MELVMQKNINEVLVDGLREHDKAYFTRTQIGELLEYGDPNRSIANIHNKHKERLDQFSAVVKLITTDGKAYDTFVYNVRGVFEICRWSRQPKADEVMDKLYDFGEEILRVGYYSAYGTPQETIAAIVNDVEDDDRRKVLIEGIKLSNVDQAQFVAELMDVPKVNLPKMIRNPSDSNSKAKWMMRNWKNRYTKSDIPDGIVGDVALDNLIVSLRRNNPSHFQRFCGTYYFDDFGYADLVYLMAKRGYIGDEQAERWVAELDYNMKFGKEKYHPAPDQSTQDGKDVSTTES